MRQVAVVAFATLSLWPVANSDHGSDVMPFTMPYDEILASQEMPVTSPDLMKIDPNADYNMDAVSNSTISMVAASPWRLVYGSLKMVSVDEGGNVWGCNSNNQIYSGTLRTPWLHVSGELKHVDVAAHGSLVWGVNTHDNIYFRAGLGGTWEQIGGSLKQVAVAPNGHVWGVNTNDAIYFRDGIGGSWEHIGGKLKYVSVGGSSGQYIWGANSNDDIYFRHGYHGSWQHVGGKLKQIEVGEDGVVWGVNADNHIYTRNGIDGSWLRVTGALKHVSVGLDVWGADLKDMIYYYDPPPGELSLATNHEATDLWRLFAVASVAAVSGGGLVLALVVRSRRATSRREPLLSDM